MNDATLVCVCVCVLCRGMESAMKCGGCCGDVEAAMEVNINVVEV